jgi:hypothetical protein
MLLLYGNSKKVSRHRRSKWTRNTYTPLAIDFRPTAEDCSIDEESARKHRKEFNSDFAS